MVRFILQVIGWAILVASAGGAMELGRAALGLAKAGSQARLIEFRDMERGLRKQIPQTDR